jgi:hypothetical protein
MTGAQAKLAYLLVMMAGCLRPQICMKERLFTWSKKTAMHQQGYMIKYASQKLTFEI